MQKSDNSFLDNTRALWQRRTSRALTQEDARQIIEHAVGFFEVLGGWAEEEAASRESIAGDASERGEDSDG